MKKLLNICMFIAVLFVCSNAQFNTYVNWAGAKDTTMIPTFANDSFRVTKAFNFTNSENKLLVLVYDDTANAARSSDSLHCEIGYQMGCPFVALDSTYDTVWTNTIVIDTINSLTASKRYNPSAFGDAPSWTLNSATEYATRPLGQIDTTIRTSESAVFLPFNPQWSPFVRFYVQGLASNAHTAIKMKISFAQRKWINVKVQ